MKMTIFRYELMVKDMAGGGINAEHSTLEQLKDIDGRITYKDKESGLLLEFYGCISCRKRQLLFRRSKCFISNGY